MEINPKKLFKDKFPTASVKLLVGSEAVQQELTEILEGVTAAEQTRALNEELRLRNEEIRDEFEMRRQSDEDERKEYEDERREKESERQSEEQKRVLAEQRRVKNDSDRGDAEYSRYLAEIDRVNAERLRDEAYKARVANDTLWEGRENKREARETERIQKEGVRESNETTRINNENTRIINESGRVMKEKERVNAEILRQAGYENWKEQVSEYSTRISNNAQEIRVVKEDLTTAPKLYGVNRYDKTVELISRSTNEVVYPITRPYAVVDENGKNLTTILDELSKSGGGIMEITYSDLKALRDSSSLTAGQFYRITDYVTTTKEVDTASANHPFDIIAFAIDSSHLCEECWAAVHEGDTYFANSELESWKVWYCLDNDTNRFDWADTTNGKGVIYRLIDNYGNDCPYDFKNILFTRYLVTRVYEMSEFEYFYYGIKNSGSYYPHDCTISSSDRSTTFYTFSAFVDEDQTIDPSDLSIGIGNPSEVYGNIIRPCYSNKRQTLNNIVFAERNCHGNYIEENCSAMTIVRSANNHIEASSEGVFMFSSGYNRIGAGSYRISLAESYNNHIGYSSAFFQLRACSYNAFGESCIDVIMGQYCSYNSLDGNNYYVRVYGGSDCNKLGKYCQFITLFENAKNNRFENTAFSCAVDGEDNTFEGYNQLVTLGYDGDRCIGRTVRKYNSGVHSRGIRAGYLEGFEVRYVLAWEDPEVEIDNANENTVTLAVYPFKVFVPEQSIMDGVSSWYCEMYDMSGALGYGGCDVEVGADGTVQSFRIDIPVEDYDAFINTEELEFEFMLYPLGDNGEQLYGSLGGVITTDESLYTYVYVWNPHFE